MVSTTVQSATSMTLVEVLIVVIHLRRPVTQKTIQGRLQSANKYVDMAKRSNAVVCKITIREFKSHCPLLVKVEGRLISSHPLKSCQLAVSNTLNVLTNTNVRDVEPPGKDKYNLQCLLYGLSRRG